MVGDESGPQGEMLLRTSVRSQWSARDAKKTAALLAGSSESVLKRMSFRVGATLDVEWELDYRRPAIGAGRLTQLW
jgi:hypothetical protein